MTLALPETLTPSKISRFMQCPLSFRYAYIDRIPQPPTRPQFLGTLVHRALQLLFSGADPLTRTQEEAQTSLCTAWDEVRASEELASLSLDGGGENALVRDASTLLSRYFEIEDPVAVNPVGVELDLRIPHEGIELRGIIDRLDSQYSGGYVITDYKTGRAPNEAFARSSMLGVRFYAFLCELIYDKRPSEIRLMYLKDRVVVSESPTDQMMRGIKQRALAVWSAIERACASGDFRPNPSRLCSYCAYQDLCPAMKSRTEPVALSS